MSEVKKKTPKRKGYWVMLSPDQTIYDDQNPNIDRPGMCSGILINRLTGSEYAYIRPEVDDAHIRHAIDLKVLSVVAGNHSKWPYTSDRDRVFVQDTMTDTRRYELHTVREPEKGKRAGLQNFVINNRGPERAILMRTKAQDIFRYIDGASLSSLLTLVQLEKHGCTACVTPRVEIIEAAEKRIKELGKGAKAQNVVVDVQETETVQIL